MKKFFLFVISFILLGGIAYAINSQAEGFRIAKNAPQEVRVHGECKKVSNNSDYADVFIGTRSAEEWNSVKNNSNAPHIVIENCRPTNVSVPNIGDNTGLNIDFDSKGRITKIKIIDGRLLYDGIYAKGIRVKFSAQDVADMTSAYADVEYFDDYFELKLNGNSVFSGPDGKSGLLMCTCTYRNGLSHSCLEGTYKSYIPDIQNLPINNVNGAGDIIDNSLLTGVMGLPYGNMYVGWDNTCTKRAGPVERDTPWRNFKSGDFKHLIRPDEYNLFLGQLIVKRHGGANYNIVFTYRD